VIGWHYDTKTIAFLLPTTGINLASLILLLVAMYMGRPVLYSTDPTDAKSLLLATTELRRGNTKIKIVLSSGEQHSFWKASGSYTSTLNVSHVPLLQGMWEAVEGTITSIVKGAGKAAAEEGVQTATDQFSEPTTQPEKQSQV
jgi:hypothetical protein